MKPHDDFVPTIRFRLAVRPTGFAVMQTGTC